MLEAEGVLEPGECTCYCHQKDGTRDVSLSCCNCRICVNCYRSIISSRYEEHLAGCEDENPEAGIGHGV